MRELKAAMAGGGDHPRWCTERHGGTRMASGRLRGDERSGGTAHVRQRERGGMRRVGAAVVVVVECGGRAGAARANIRAWHPPSQHECFRFAGAPPLHRVRLPIPSLLPNSHRASKNRHSIP